MSSVQLQTFLSVAQQADQNASIKVSGSSVKDTGALGTFFTKAEVHRESMRSFVNALQEQYGSQIAKMASSFLPKIEDGQPLKAHMVKDLINLADGEMARIAQHNIESVDKFISGSDPAHSLDSAVKALCDEKRIPEDKRGALKERVKESLLRNLDSGSLNKELRDLEALQKGVSWGWSALVGGENAVLASLLSLPACADSPFEDVERLAHSGLGAGIDRTLDISEALCSVAWALPAMRAAQPEGTLTPETVWQCTFNEPLPSEVKNGAVSLGKAMQDRLESVTRDLETRHHINKGAVLSATAYMSLEAVKNMLDLQQPVDLRSIPNIKNLISNIGNRAKAVQCLERDLQRLGIAPKGDELERLGLTTWPSPVFTFHYPDEHSARVTVGRETDFPFTDAADRGQYLGGNSSSLSRNLADQCRALCGEGASEAQVTNTMLCLGQSVLIPLRHTAALAGANFNEHSNVSVELSKMPDGSIHAKLSSPDELASHDGKFAMSIEIKPDGEMSVSEFSVIPPPPAGV
jgi:hypothetical protein